MKPFSRGLFLLFAILSLILFTTGCEQLLTEIPFLGNIQPSNQQTVTETPSPTPIPQTTSTVVTPEVDPNQIILWLPPEFDPENGTEAGTLLKEQLESFATDQPDLNIEIRIKAPTGAGGMLDTLSSASLAAPGVVPGILIMTRTEFENRAVLYRILYDLEELITIKKRFIETLTPDEIKRFWNTSQNCCQ